MSSQILDAQSAHLVTPARRAPEATAELRTELAAAARDIVAREGPAA